MRKTYQYHYRITLVLVLSNTLNVTILFNIGNRYILAKLIKILAASMGGGLVLGVGIRLGEAIAARDRPAGMEPAPKLAERLGELENRLLSLEAESPQAISHSEGDSQEAGVAEAGLLGELRDWLEESVTSAWPRWKRGSGRNPNGARRQMLDAFAESVQTRVIHRISRLEEEVAGQSAAMSELRECSLRTEQSIQKLLGGLDRLIAQNPAKL